MTTTPNDFPKNPGAFPEQELLATGESLNATIDQLVAQGTESKPTLNKFSLTMARLLADRIGGDYGVVPFGYVMATELLCADAGATGVDGFTGEPMPEEVTKQSAMAYSVFKMETSLFARTAFGDEFADQVEEIRRSIQNPSGSPEDERSFTLDELEHMYQFLSEAKTTREAVTDKSGYYDILKEVPGVDPVLASVDGHPEDIPNDGWLVNSHIAAGYGGVINVYRYNGGLGINPERIRDNREKYGQVGVDINLKGYGSFTIAYENPAFPQKDVEPYQRMSQTSYNGLSFDSTDITNLENSGRLLASNRPLTVGKGSMSTSLNWEDIDRKKEHDSADVDINRVTADHEELAPILSILGQGMGLGEQDITSLVEEVRRKTAA